jgi:predicted dehydrogenase
MQKRAISGLSSRRATLSAPGLHRRIGVARTRHKPSRCVRYAVVGAGYIAQVAVLPAFRHALRNSRLVALFSDDPTKRRELGRKYKIPTVAAYTDFDAILGDGQIDAVYLALPNSMHKEFAIRAAKAGVHVLCEKPLAVTERECRQMIDACQRYHVKLMTAYRLHFDKANLAVVETAKSGKLGSLRYFNSSFSMQVNSPNIRLEHKMGGGPLYDLGVYCINAARYLFGDEPSEVVGVTATGSDKRFREVEEMVGATLRFPGERLATFVCSFGAADVASYILAGTKGTVTLENAFEYAQPIEMEIAIGDNNRQSRKFAMHDQFAPELLYFSECILRNREPEPSGAEGLMDVRVIEAIYRSARAGKPIKLGKVSKTKRPSGRQQIERPPVSEPRLVHAESAGRS